MAETRIALEVARMQAAGFDARLAALGLRRERPEMGIAFLDPATWALLIGGVSALALLLMEVVDFVRGGTLIDMQRDPAKVERSSAVPAGMIVVLTRDGRVEIEVREMPKSRLQWLIEQLLRLPVTAGRAEVEALLAAG